MTLTIRLFFALFITLVLTIIPMPELLTGFRPPWIFLFVLYVQFFLPRYFSITFLFLLGISLDVLLSTVIGEHAFVLLFTTWLISGKARRFNLFPIGQQMVLVALFSMIYQLIIVLIDAFLGYHYNVIMAVGSAFVSMLLWPWVRLLADSAFPTKPLYRSHISPIK